MISYHLQFHKVGALNLQPHNGRIVSRAAKPGSIIHCLSWIRL